MQDFPYGMAAFSRAAAQGGRSGRRTRSAGRFGSRAKQRRIGSRGNVSARLCGSAFGPLRSGAQPYRSGAARDMRPRRLRRIPSLTAVRAFKQGGGQASLGVGKTAGERHAAVGLRKPQKARVRSDGASFAENRRRKSAVPHRRRRTRARRTPRRYTNRRRRAIP